MNQQPFFSAPFRPFFFLATLQAIFAPMFYVCFLVSDYQYFGTFFHVTDWHIFEMLYGFVPVLISGFILTAGSHWSGNPMQKGWPLIIMSLIWIMERIFNAFNLLSPFYLLFFLQIYGLIFIYLFHITVKGNKKNHLPFLLFLLALFIGKFLFSYGAYTQNEDLLHYGKSLAIGLFRLILIWIAGRVVPFFIKKRFPEIEISIPFPLHYSAYIAKLLLIPFEMFQAPDAIISGTAFAAFVLHSIKLTYFKPLQTKSEPMVWILNLAYFFICMHLLFLSMEFFFPALTNGQGTLHIFTTGGLGLMAVGIMTRVSLGHSGRPIKASQSIVLLFALVALGSIARVFIPILFPDYHYDFLHFSMGIWTMGFVILLFKFTPIWFRARL